jgi:methionine sulfoxide reductase heme-binding subunit
MVMQIRSPISTPVWTCGRIFSGLPMTQSQWRRRIVKPLVFLLSLAPVLLLTYNFFTENLSANPVADITNTTGTWTLRFLMMTLAVSPIRNITGLNIVPQLRRMLGLFAFFYGCLHFTTYVWLDQSFAWGDIMKDIAKRPFITFGLASFVLMIPLAVTSWNLMIRWMGGRRWKALHRLVYVTGIGGVVHYLWLVKADTQRPLMYGALLALLLGYRLWEGIKQKYPVATVEEGKG